MMKIYIQQAAARSPALDNLGSVGIPVELATKFELAINMKTAKAIGITISNSPLQRVDKPIE